MKRRPNALGPLGGRTIEGSQAGVKFSCNWEHRQCLFWPWLSRRPCKGYPASGCNSCTIDRSITAPFTAPFTAPAKPQTQGSLPACRWQRHAENYQKIIPNESFNIESRPVVSRLPGSHVQVKACRERAWANVSQDIKHSLSFLEQKYSSTQTQHLHLASFFIFPSLTLISLHH